MNRHEAVKIRIEVLLHYMMTKMEDKAAETGPPIRQKNFEFLCSWKKFLFLVRVKYESCKIREIMDHENSENIGGNYFTK